MATIGDVILVYYREEAAFFARIDSIEPDIKKGWYKVQLLILTMPVRAVTWILREEYLNGMPFTMEDNPVRIEAVKPLPNDPDSDDARGKPSGKDSTKEGRKVIPFKKIKRDPLKDT